MTHPRTRRSLTASILVLSAAAILGTAGCSGTDRQGGVVANLSDLPNKSQSMLKLGDASRAAGDCAAALRFYRLATSKSDDKAESAGARLGSAECHLAMGDSAAAERDYLAAAKLSPRDPGPMAGLGRVYLIEHQPGRAEGYLDLAIKYGARAAFVWNDKGVAFDQLRRHQEAQTAYRQGLAEHPGDRALSNNLALSLAMTGTFPEAEGLLRQLAAEPNATARTRENLALVLGLEGNDAAAREISEADLDGAALDNNTRFYAYARALLTGAPLPSAIADATRPAARTAAVAPRARTARIAASVPLPVIVAAPPKLAQSEIVTTKAAPAQIAAIPEPILRNADTGANSLLPDVSVASTQPVSIVPHGAPVASSDNQ
jgi:Flp pilus assembly protein TadD